jgi:ubiquinone/menaquinone biosynthesis C-methylase UbiE
MAIEQTKKPSHQTNTEYYESLGMLFWELSEHSRCFNFGYCEPGQANGSPAELQRQLVRFVANSGNFTAGQRLIEVGCGLGGPAELIANEFGCHVIGIDPGEYQVTRANQWLREQRNPPDISFLRGDAHFLPFRSSRFDGLYSIESAFHYSDKSTFLKEAARVIAPHGKIVIADILKTSRQTMNWLNRQISQSIAASNFFNRDAYERSSAACGLKMTAVMDITQEVKRCFSVWTKAHLRKFPEMRRVYPVRSLIKIGLALRLAPLIIAITDFSYQIMVFEKEH